MKPFPTSQMRNGRVTTLQHLCRWSPYPCLLFQWSQWKVCVDFSTPRSKFRKSLEQWPFSHWHVDLLWSAIRCLVRVERQAFSYLSTLADDPFCMRHFCVENWVTKHPNQILCKQRKPSVRTKKPRLCGWTNNSNYGAEKHNHAG